MIAEIHGKISSTGSNLSERLEDQLTSDVFGALRYIDAQAGLIPFLESSYFLAQDGQRTHLNLDNAMIKQVRFWPWIIEAEPDVLIEATKGDNTETMILVEAKYYSRLGGEDTPEAAIRPEDDMGTIPDSDRETRASSSLKSSHQLIRQMRGMKARYPGLRRIQIFLTTDRIYPREILSSVRRQADAEGLEDTELYWLSWHDLTAVLHRSLGQRGETLAEREKIVVSDLLLLCARKGFEKFARLEVPTHAPLRSFSLVIQSQFLQAPMPLVTKFPMVPKAIPSPIHTPKQDT